MSPTSPTSSPAPTRAANSRRGDSPLRRLRRRSACRLLAAKEKASLAEASGQAYTRLIKSRRRDQVMISTDTSSTASVAHSFAAISGGALLASGVRARARAGDRREAGAASSSSFAARSAAHAALRHSTESATSTTPPSVSRAVRPSQVVDSTVLCELKSCLRHLIRARYYDPKAGRFLGEDPLPDVNLYPYVNNSPVDLTDPFG
ncbi:MAG: RHS repeat-associated core domain-containing protein, partial [Pseudomonadota bacterium]